MVRARALSSSWRWILMTGLPLILCAKVATAGGPPAPASAAPTVAAYPQLTSEAARDLIQSHRGRADFAVLDVRTPEEFKAGRLPGAINVDFQAPDFERQVSGLDRSKTYLVYCRSGRRSAQALEVLARQGFPKVLHLQNGVLEWNAKGFALEH